MRTRRLSTGCIRPGTAPSSARTWATAGARRAFSPTTLTSCAFRTRNLTSAPSSWRCLLYLESVVRWRGSGSGVSRQGIPSACKEADTSQKTWHSRPTRPPRARRTRRAFPGMIRRRCAPRLPCWDLSRRAARWPRREAGSSSPCEGQPTPCQATISPSTSRGSVPTRLPSPMPWPSSLSP